MPKKIEEPKIKNWVSTKDGKTVEYSGEMETAKVKKLSRHVKSKVKDLINMNDKEIKELLDRQQKAIQAIADAMVEGQHYIHIDGTEGKYITQEGSDLLLRASGTRLEYELIDKTINLENNLIDYEYKAVAFMNERKIGEAIASYNSKEDRMRKHYETYDKTTQTWTPKANKSVFDIKNTLQQNAQKRAKNRLVRNVFAISGALFASEDEIKNPKANKQLIFSIYTLLYKYHLHLAPKAPTKRKLRGDKWHHLTDKEKQEYRKEWVRVNVLQPYLLKQGLPTSNMGIEDVKIIKDAIPNIKTGEEVEIEKN